MFCKDRLQNGFTLIEVLIALAITAFVAAIAYASLSSVISGVESTRAASEQTYELNRALMFISRDLRQFVARPVMDEFGQREPAMTGGSLARYTLSFTRNGWHNSKQINRSNLQRVNYLMEEGALWRESYFVLDRLGDSEPQRVKLLDGVEELTVAFVASVDAMDTQSDGKTLDTRNWVQNWPVDRGSVDVEVPPPAAVEVRLQLEDWGEISRLYELPSH
ncbi:MAG: general secretion pathway protein J [Halioglobus sp.]